MSAQSQDSPGSDSGTSRSLAQQNGQQKKRRIPGACDNCKRKKIRCDSAEMPGNRCTNCIQASLECTHKEVSKTLGSAKGYVESLEIRLEKMEKLLNKLRPGIDISQELDGAERSPTPPDLGELSRNDDDVQDESELVNRMRKLSVNPPQGVPFFGKSSGYTLVQTALDIRSETHGDPRKFHETLFMGCKRPELWENPPWHPAWTDRQPTPHYKFPEEDLMRSFIDLYFSNVNAYMPTLHRPTFEKSVREGLHHTNIEFGATLLLVCALGARYSTDPRALYPGQSSLRSCGWKWYEQVSVMDRTFEAVPTLAELQNFALYILFRQGTEIAHGTGTILGIALRRCEEIGAHRRRPLKAPTALDEQWKRAFWVLLATDRLTCCFTGRQSALQDESFDVEMPLDCDDEYWEVEDPELKFKQPEGKPSANAFFTALLNLINIQNHAMRVIYSVRKPPLTIGQTTQQVNQQIIADLDSALNSWIDNIPEHLRWDPNREDQLFHKQSATLHALYYHLQIFIHRPFIPSKRNPTPSAFPSLAICTNAARSCCHVLACQTQRDEMPWPGLHLAVFTAAIVLFLNIWSGRRSGIVPNPKREMEDVRRCISILGACESRWCYAGRLRDLLQAMSAVGDVTFVHPTRSKRPRDPDEASPSEPSTDPAWTSTAPTSRPVAGSKRVSNVSRSPQQVSPTVNGHTPDFALPMSGAELGRLPVYGQFNFSDTTKIPVFGASQLDGHGPTEPKRRNTMSNYLSGSISDASTASLSPESVDQSSDFDQLDLNQIFGSQPLAMPMDLVNMTALNGTSGVPYLDNNDALAMWSNISTGFELNDLGSYMTNIDQMMHNQANVSQPGGVPPWLFQSSSVPFFP